MGILCHNKWNYFLFGRIILRKGFTWWQTHSAIAYSGFCNMKYLQSVTKLLRQCLQMGYFREQDNQHTSLFPCSLKVGVFVVSYMLLEQWQNIASMGWGGERFIYPFESQQNTRKAPYQVIVSFTIVLKFYILYNKSQIQGMNAAILWRMTCDVIYPDTLKHVFKALICLSS